jgi:hypothetical protein
MKRKYIFWVTILLLVFLADFLFLCQYNKTLLTGSFHQKEEDLFKNKQKCFAYIDKININLEESNKVLSKSGIISTLEEVWFSKIENSCLFSTKVLIIDKNKENSKITYSIYNFLQSKRISFSTSEEEYQEQRNKFQ